MYSRYQDLSNNVLDNLLLLLPMAGKVSKCSLDAIKQSKKGEKEAAE